MKNIAIVILCSLFSALMAIAGYRYMEGPRELIVQEQAPARYANYVDNLLTENVQRSFSSATPTSFTEAAAKVTPAVVNIRASSESDFDWWGGSSYGGSSGSGIIVSPDGFIVTNNHVIEEGKDIEVTLNDKRKFKAKVIGTDPLTDLALIKVKTTDLPFLLFGNSDQVKVGEWVLAVGNPFNLESTVTAGIVSAKGRNINILEQAYSIESFIQTDAAVNPGNSGGALVNTAGKLVGVNTAIITRSGRYEGYSFAIPANLAQKVVKDLKEYGKVQRAILGVGIDEVTDQRAKSLGLGQAEGVYLTRVYDDSAAENAGLEKGDVIVSINGKKTKTIPELQEQVGGFRPGDTADVEYFRDGRTYKTRVILKNKDNTESLSAVFNAQILDDLGFELRDLGSDEMNRLKVKGVKVISVYRGSRIEDTNMDPGFIIMKVNENKVETISELVAELEEAKGKVKLEGIYENFPGMYQYEFINR